MNAERRKEIDRAAALVDEALQIIQACADEEREFYDNMPESLQDGEKGQAAETAADTLQQAADDLDNVKASLDEAVA